MLTAKEWARIEELASVEYEIQPDEQAVPDELAAEMYAKAEPVRSILAKYTRLVFSSGQVLDIDVEKLVEYESMLEVAIHAESNWLLKISAGALLDAIQYVKDREKYEAPFLARRLYQCLSIA